MEGRVVRCTGERVWDGCLVGCCRLGTWRADLCLARANSQVFLDKPLGVKFARGNDGGAYVTRRCPFLAAVLLLWSAVLCCCTACCFPQLLRCMLRHVVCTVRSDVCLPRSNHKLSYTGSLPAQLALQLSQPIPCPLLLLCSDPKLGNTDERIEAGDKVVKVSASFGDDVWDALNFGQVSGWLSWQVQLNFLWASLRAWGEFSASCVCCSCSDPLIQAS